MKHRVWTQHLISAVFAFILSVSAIGNLISGYELPTDPLWKLYLLCGFFAASSSLLFRFRYGESILVCLTAVALFILWRKEILWQQTQFLSYLITSHYHDVYAWKIIGTPASGDVSLPMILWSALTSACVNWYFYRRRNILAVLLPVVSPLVLCLLTTDKVPNTDYLYFMILGLAVLLITDWSRHHSPTQGAKLILRTTLPIAVLLAMLFVLNPRDEYINHAGTIQKEVMSRFQELLDHAETISSGKPVSSAVNEKLNLRTVGPKRQVSYSVMRVNSPIDGILYLRGRDYDQYTGAGWESSSDRIEVFTSGIRSAGELSIVTYGVRSVLYVPYYTSKEISLVGGSLDNKDNLQRYSYYLSSTFSGNSITPGSRYTKLPENTLAWAKNLAEEITSGTASDTEKAMRIQNYIRNSAVYDLSTPRMDSEASDFAQWFLNESETGYCVHFATASTVLLRSAGIPARYVEGYMINCNASSDVVVTNQDAHAWAEYYDSDSGAWRILESTPADLEDVETEPVAAIPETETSPEDIQEEDHPETVPSNADNSPNNPDNNLTDEPETPDDSLGNTAEQGKKSLHISNWLKTVFKYLILISCIPLQALVRIYWKESMWNHGDSNERAINRWIHTRKLSKLLKLPYPGNLENLAQKAEFSQHRILPEELAQFEEFRLSAKLHISEKPWYSRILYLWIFAIE